VLHSGNRLEIDALTQVVAAGALVVAACNAIAAALGGWAYLRGLDAGPHARSASAFWAMLRVGQGSALALAIAVGSLAADGHRSSDGLFYLYVLLALAVAFVAEQLRAACAQTILDQRGLQDAAAVGRLPEPEQHELVAAIVRREVGVMALSALVVVFLALRAAGTAHGF
jgi:hypothetical protein